MLYAFMSLLFYKFVCSIRFDVLYMCIDSYVIQENTTLLEHIKPWSVRVFVYIYNTSSFCVVSLLSLGFYLVVFKSLACWRLQPLAFFKQHREGFRQAQLRLTASSSPGLRFADEVVFNI